MTRDIALYEGAEQLMRTFFERERGSRKTAQSQKNFTRYHHPPSDLAIWWDSCLIIGFIKNRSKKAVLFLARPSIQCSNTFFRDIFDFHTYTASGLL